MFVREKKKFVIEWKPKLLYNEWMNGKKNRKKWNRMECNQIFNFNYKRKHSMLTSTRHCYWRWLIAILIHWWCGSACALQIQNEKKKKSEIDLIFCICEHTEFSMQTHKKKKTRHHFRWMPPVCDKRNNSHFAIGKSSATVFTFGIFPSICSQLCEFSV